MLGLNEIADTRGVRVKTAINHIDELIAAGADIDISYLMPVADRTSAIKAAFEKTEGSRLAPVKEILGLEYSYDEIHLVRVRMSQEGYFDQVIPSVNNP